MSTYKVIQDIEAEDHILGPLSLRQFIYGLITVFLLYICFICLTKHVGFMLIIFFPPALFTGFFAFPFGKDQPTEVWALAKIRFFFKPRKRIWNQSGVKELVTVTVPKKIEVQRTNGLSQTEVKSRLSALADTIDTRGWAIKNVTTGTYQPTIIPVGGEDSERLLSFTSLPQAVPDYQVPADADILDDQASPLAQQFTTMINTSAQNHRKKLMDELNQVRATNNQTAPTQWFAASPLAGPQPVTAQPVAAPGPLTAVLPESEAMISAELQAKLAAQAQANVHLHTLQPTGPAQVGVPDQPTSASVPDPTVPPERNAAILNLAKNNDLNVATLAREASKSHDLEDDGEVVVALH